MYYSKYFFVCVWHTFLIDSNFALVHVWPTLLSSFSHHWKNQIANPPKSNIWFSNVDPHIMFAILRCSCMGGNIKKYKYNCITHFLMYPCCATKWESCSTKKFQWPWWQPDHRTWFKRTHQMPSLSQFQWCTTPYHYHGKVPRPYNCPETTSMKKTPIFAQICGVREPPNSHAKGRKEGPFLILPNPASHSLTPSSLNVSGRECILV
jgi:hypothetical protein